MFDGKGAIFGVAIVAAKIATILAIRRLFKSSATNSPNQFLFTFFTISTIFLFVFEIFQHNIHDFLIYIWIWKMPNFWLLIFAFFVIFFVFLRFFVVKTLVKFEISTIFLVENARICCQFHILNYIYENIAERDFVKIPSENRVFLILSVILTIFACFSDSRKIGKK
ncbi:unnamed protein product [Caenorhabditis angaria]|uniref:Uncharacterized protein n=1 Tax=Caenorhabditis angaria TaxID=860376 RepID=A0A9P1N438_9PELO|nr:unnamed protein product [Caenorhabditis angaria]